MSEQSKFNLDGPIPEFEDFGSAIAYALLLARELKDAPWWRWNLSNFDYSIVKEMLNKGEKKKGADLWPECSCCSEKVDSEIILHSLSYRLANLCLTCMNERVSLLINKATEMSNLLRKLFPTVKLYYPAGGKPEYYELINFHLLDEVPSIYLRYDDIKYTGVPVEAILEFNSKLKPGIDIRPVSGTVPLEIPPEYKADFSDLHEAFNIADYIAEATSDVKWEKVNPDKFTKHTFTELATNLGKRMDKRCEHCSKRESIFIVNFISLGYVHLCKSCLTNANDLLKVCAEFHDLLKSSFPSLKFRKETGEIEEGWKFEAFFFLDYYVVIKSPNGEIKKIDKWDLLDMNPGLKPIKVNNS